MQAADALGIRFRPADMREAAGGHQPAAKRPQPHQPLIRRRIRRRHAGTAQPGQRMRPVERIDDVHRPVQHDLEAQRRSRVDPGHPHATAGAIVQNRGLDAPELGRIRYFPLEVIDIHGLIIQLVSNGGNHRLRPSCKLHSA